MTFEKSRTAKRNQNSWKRKGNGVEAIAVGFFVFLVIAGIITTVSNLSNKKKMNDLMDGTPQISSANRSGAIESELDQIRTQLNATSEQTLELCDQLEKGEITLEEFEKRREELQALSDRLIKELEAKTEELVAQPVERAPQTSNAAYDGQMFVTTDKYLAKDGNGGIAVDRTNMKFALLTPYSKEIVGYDQLVSSEVCVDSETMLQTDRLGQVGGAAIGGLLTGGIGALVMAMGAKKKQIENVKKVELKVLVSGTVRHSHTIRFFGLGIGGSARSAIEEATKWHDLISVAIREAPDKHLAEMPVASSSQTQSLTEELGRLADFRTQGILSEEEFQRAKAKLI